MPDWLLPDGNGHDKDGDKRHKYGKSALDKQEDAAEDLLEGLGAGMDDEPELRF